MEYRNFGRTGMKVSSLTLGCMNFGGRTNEKDSNQIISKAIDSGINIIDTANVYGHKPDNFNVGRGRSEEIVGKFINDYPNRDHLIIATKMYFSMSNDVNSMGSSRKNIIRECEKSLQRLKTDYIDLYQIHHPTNEIPIDETLRALDDLIKSGKVRYIGTSSFPAWQIMESLWIAKEYGLNRFVSEQPVYNLLDRRIERELIPMAKTYGIAVINWSPLAGGFLTGKYKKDKEVPTDNRYSSFWKGEKQRHDDKKAYEVIKVLDTMAVEKNCNSLHIALNWSMSQEGICSSIIGPRTLSQLESCIKSVEIDLSVDDLKKLDEISPPGDKIIPYYGLDGFAWSGWGNHRYR